jgi:23S rRNA (adenine2030-N6)-methyltransferase
MKYRHAFHAGNFADVHKHVALLALLSALKRKDKGFLYFESHAGPGAYEAVSQRASLERILGGAAADLPEIARYSRAVETFRSRRGNPRAYPGSPLLAAAELRPQDRAILIESQPAEARALEVALGGMKGTRVEVGDGFAGLRAHLPPMERRALVLIDPPYEETDQDYERIASTIQEALRRLESCVLAAWYPIKKASDLEPWHARLARVIRHATLVSELWVYPTDSRVSLNGSGLVIINPPYRMADRMQIWLPGLAAALDTRGQAGASVRWLVSPT